MQYPDRREGVHVAREIHSAKRDAFAVSRAQAQPVLPTAASCLTQDAYDLAYLRGRRCHKQCACIYCKTAPLLVEEPGHCDRIHRFRIKSPRELSLPFLLFACFSLLSAIVRIIVTRPRRISCDRSSQSTALSFPPRFSYLPLSLISDDIPL